MKVILGLIGLGIVVFIHELGHFIAAKLSGIGVEVFSLGWGKRLFSVTYKGTEYRLSLLPIGGYCKLKGEDTLKSSEGTFKAEPGSFYAASPLKRMFVPYRGPYPTYSSHFWPLPRCGPSDSPTPPFLIGSSSNRISLPELPAGFLLPKGPEDGRRDSSDQ